MWLEAGSGTFLSTPFFLWGAAAGFNVYQIWNRNRIVSQLLWPITVTCFVTSHLRDHLWMSTEKLRCGPSRAISYESSQFEHIEVSFRSLFLHSKLKLQISFISWTLLQKGFDYSFSAAWKWSCVWSGAGWHSSFWKVWIIADVNVDIGINHLEHTLLHIEYYHYHNPIMIPSIRLDHYHFVFLLSSTAHHITVLSECCNVPSKCCNIFLGPPMWELYNFQPGLLFFEEGFYLFLILFGALLQWGLIGNGQECFLVQTIL